MKYINIVVQVIVIELFLTSNEPTWMDYVKKCILIVWVLKNHLAPHAHHIYVCTHPPVQSEYP